MTTTIDSADTSVIDYVNGAQSDWVFTKTVGSGNVLDSTLSEANGAASVVFKFTGEAGSFSRIAQSLLM